MPEKKQQKKKPQKKQSKKQQSKFVIFLNKLFAGKEKDYFIENLTMLIGSGMSMSIALRSIKQETRNEWMIETIDDITESIEGGSSLSSSFKGKDLLSSHDLSLLRIGEESGYLLENLKVIVAEQKKEKIFKSKIRSAMMYPIFILVLTAIIGLGIAWFILPRLASVFSSLKLELPLVTRILIATGKFLEGNGFWAIPCVVLILAIIFFFVFIFSKTKFIGQKILISTPGVKQLIREVELARFGYLLGTLLKASLPIVKSLDSMSKATTFRSYQRFYVHCRDSIMDGNSFQKSFLSYPKSHKFIPTPIQQIIISAEKSGNLAGSLIEIGKTFEEKTDNSTKNLAVILEPVLLVVVWVGVVGVALAVILPIYSLVGGLGNQQNSISSPPPIKIEKLEENATITGEFQEEKLIEFDNGLKILKTNLGYLSVRDKPSLDGVIIDEVNPDDIFEYKKEENGWYEIILDKEAQKTGWVVEKYIEVIK